MPYYIHREIDNYLKYMDNIESASQLTLKAYRVDLEQAFLNKQKSDYIRNKNNNLINFVEIKQRQFETGEDLWALCRPALTHWGKLSLASRNRKTATLKSFFNWLYNEKIINKNYADQLVCPKVPKKIPNFISVDEVLAVLSFLNTQKLDTPNIKILFHLLYGGGLRISEACELKWSNVDLDQKRILVRGKGSKERYIVLPQICCDTLTQARKTNTDATYVFGNKPLNPRTGYKYINDLGYKVGLLNPLTPHALRHSYATHMLASGTNLRTLQFLLGHESLQATEKYTHLNIDMLARTVEIKHPLSKKKIVD